MKIVPINDAMSKVLESDRSILRPWLFPEDREAFFAIYRDREVTEFLPKIRRLATSADSLGDFFAWKLRTLRERQDGLDWWAMIDRETGEAIGSIILQNLPDNAGNLTEEIEIGWHLRRDCWGRGYVTEAARVILEYGFHALQLPIIYAVVHPDNRNSIRVTERLGMRSMGITDRYYGQELRLFAIETGTNATENPYPSTS